MAINLRSIGKELQQSLKVRAAAEGVTIESLCVRFLWWGLGANQGGRSSAVDSMTEAKEILANNVQLLEYPIEEVPVCGKTWWEDGTQYECLMDRVHREQKHGLRGMVRRLED